MAIFIAHVFKFDTIKYMVFLGILGFKWTGKFELLVLEFGSEIGPTNALVA